MANSAANDNASQFFFTLGDCKELNRKHTLFGKIGGATVFNMIKLNESLIVDLSASFDINGDPLTYQWKLNSDAMANTGNKLALDTSKTGMNLIEVKISDSSK